MVRAIRVMLVYGLVVLLLARHVGQLVCGAVFLPEEDQGYFIVVAQLPDGASKQRTDGILERIEKVFQANPAIHSTDAMHVRAEFCLPREGSKRCHDVCAAASMGRTHRTAMSRPIADRDGVSRVGQDARSASPSLYAPSLRGVGTVGGFSAQLQDPSRRRLQEKIFGRRTAIYQTGEKRNQPSDRWARTAEYVRRVCMPMSIANEPKHSGYRSPTPLTPCWTITRHFTYINDFLKFGRIYHVQTEADAEYGKI